MPTRARTWHWGDGAQLWLCHSTLKAPWHLIDNVSKNYFAETWQVNIRKGKQQEGSWKLISSCKFDLWKISQMCVTTNSQIRRYLDHANVFTRKTLENNPNGWKEKGQFWSVWNMNFKAHHEQRALPQHPVGWLRCLSITDETAHVHTLAHLHKCSGHNCSDVPASHLGSTNSYTPTAPPCLSLKLPTVLTKGAEQCYN